MAIPTLQWPSATHNPSPIYQRDIGTYWRFKWSVLRMFSRLNARQRRRDREQSPWIDLGGEA